MDFILRNRGLVAFGAVWGLVLAALPAVFAFDDPFSLSPFLVSAFVCSTLAGIVGALLAGRWVSGRSGVFAALMAGVSHGVVFSVLASLSIWVCLAVNISGFSVATPGNVFNLVSSPGIFAMSGVAARAIFLYALVVGIVLSPVSGGFVLRMVRGRGVAGYSLSSGKGSI